MFEIKFILQARAQLNLLARDQDTGDLDATHAMITLNDYRESDTVILHLNLQDEAVDSSGVISYAEDVTGFSIFTFKRDVNLPDNDDGFIFRFFLGDTLCWESDPVGKSNLVLFFETPEPVDFELTLKPFEFYFNLVDETGVNSDSLAAFEVAFTGSRRASPRFLPGIYTRT